jgi:hypothetical protein
VSRRAALALLVGVLAGGALAAPGAGAWRARPLLLEFGPNDRDYVRGFREEWEREGRTRFHWTSPSARVSLPVRLQGEGHVLRLRVRRHFVEPAHVRLTTEGRTIGAPFDLQADTKVPYRLLELPLPPLSGRDPFVLLIEAPSENPRPLGIALDWMEISRRGPEAQILPLPGMGFRLALVAVAAFVALVVAGAPLSLAAGFAGALVLAGAVGTWWDLVACERIVREGWGPFAAVAAVVAAVGGWPRSRAALGLPSPRWAGAVAAIVLAALAVRLVMLLHPQFYYPDVRIHAAFAWQLFRRGPIAFLQEFTANQYRFSLGLQNENGHWYAFPYPPAFYALCWPLLRVFGLRPEVAVSVLAAAVNSLEALLVFGIARRLKLSAVLALAASLAHPLLPLFLARLTLAYFPALVGHFVDVVVVFYFLARRQRLDRARVVLALAALLAAALLTYTQSLVNFGILLPLVLLAEIAFDRTPGARRRQVGLAAAGALGVLLALAVFYGRYVPIFLDMRRGVPMPEEQILLEKWQRAPALPAEELAPQEPEDPYAQPSFNPWRGVRKAGWRLWVFYGVFSPVVIAGLALLLRSSAGPEARFVAVWGSTYLILNLASGGLPGPNLFRYNKDHEIVAPLFCMALGAVGAWLWHRARPLALVYALAYLAFALPRAHTYLIERFVLER